MQTKRVCLWSGPRNISTALMYAFAQRSDTEVVDEPFYAHYLHSTGALHPGRDAVIASMETDADAVISDVVLGTCVKPVLFMKQMAHHLVNIDRSFMQETVNILLIRDPKEMLPSLTQVIGIPTLKDTGLKIQAELLTELRQIGQTPPILDAKELLLNPKHVLSILCSQLDIPFEEEMLSWKSGGHSSDGVWAPHWYENVHRSMGFVPYKPKSEPFPTELEAVLSECLPYYEILRADAICSDSALSSAVL